MKRIAVVVLCLLVSRAASSAPKERPLLLWRVEKDGAVSHLLGTCHLPIPVEHALPATHDAALSRARVLYDEIDLGDLDPLTALRVTAGSGHLSDQIGEEAWGTLSRRVRDTLPAAILDRMHPWAAWAIIAMTPSTATPTTTGGKPAPVFLDKAITDRALATGVERRHLETLEQQASLMSQFDPAFVTLLGSGGMADAASQAEAAAILDACSTGDITAGEAYVSNPAYAELVVPMFDVRNASWMVTLEPELAQGGVFVAVGAGHMLGPHGLLTLLTEQGYTVQRLTGPRSRFKLPAEVFPGLAEQEAAPAPDPALVAAWQQNAPVAADIFCAEGTMHRVCFEPDAQQCVQQVTHDLELCYAQWGDQLPPIGTELEQTLTTQIIGCSVTGLILDAIVAGDLSQDPMCTPVWAAMEAKGM